MSDNYKVCQKCGGRVPQDHQGRVCPLCGEETAFNYVMTADTGHYVIEGQPVTLKHVAKWWVWNWRYSTVCILATVGSVIFCFVPGWGGVVGAACTFIATGTGFKAGVRYHKEIIR